MSADTSKYKKRRGGIQIEPGGLTEAEIDSSSNTGPAKVTPGIGLGAIGTLGCFVQVGGDTPSVHAVTNYHCVGMPMSATPTNLKVDNTPPHSQIFTFSLTDSSSTVLAGTLVVINFIVVADPTHKYAVYHTAGAHDTPTQVVDAVRTKILGLGHGLQAGGTGSILDLSGNQLVAVSFFANVYSPPANNPYNTLTAAVDGSTITFSGGSKQATGVYVTFNVGGPTPTQGVFLPIPPEMPVDFLAQAIVQTVQKLNPSGVTVEATDASVKFTGVQQVDCQVQSDIRVGQPDNEFHTCRCLKCCDHRIGMISFARLDLDIAFIQLDPGIVYRADIEDIGVITGTHDVRTDAAGAHYSKRGRTTRRTDGTLVDPHGAITYGDDFADEQDSLHGNTPEWFLFQRHFAGAFIATTGDTDNPFAKEGDSGSAVVTFPVTDSSGNSTTELVGIMFGDASTGAYFTPIADILAAATSWFGAPVTVVTGTTTGVDLTVPTPAVTADAVSAMTSIDPEADGLLQVERQLVATPGGQYYSGLIMNHFTEAHALVNDNVRMATVWHRNGGPAIINDALRMLQTPGERISPVINGTPLADCLQQIVGGFSRYGSPTLAADLAAHSPALIDLAAYSYPELLTALRKPISA